MGLAAVVWSAMVARSCCSCFPESRCFGWNGGLARSQNSSSQRQPNRLSCSSLNCLIGHLNIYCQLWYSIFLSVISKSSQFKSTGQKIARNVFPERWDTSSLDSLPKRFGTSGKTPWGFNFLFTWRSFFINCTRMKKKTAFVIYSGLDRHVQYLTLWWLVHKSKKNI